MITPKTLSNEDYDSICLTLREIAIVPAETTFPSKELAELYWQFPWYRVLFAWKGSLCRNGLSILAMHDLTGQEIDQIKCEMDIMLDDAAKRWENYIPPLRLYYCDTTKQMVYEPAFAYPQPLPGESYQAYLKRPGSWFAQLPGPLPARPNGIPLGRINLDEVGLEREEGDIKAAKLWLEVASKEKPKAMLSDWRSPLTLDEKRKLRRLV